MGAPEVIEVTEVAAAFLWAGKFRPRGHAAFFVDVLFVGVEGDALQSPLTESQRQM